MPIEELATIFRQAAEIAASLPPTLQPIAFEKALGILLLDSARPKRRAGVGQRQWTNQQQPVTVARASTRTNGRVGPKSALSQLLEQGYFEMRHEIAEIQAHLKDSHGHEYSSKELAVSLLRLVREGDLRRGKTAGGQYEYWTHSDEAELHNPSTFRRGKVSARLLTDGGGR